jgi:ATP-dependent Clp protease ATP-binding subunit ClpC
MSVDNQKYPAVILNDHAWIFDEHFSLSAVNFRKNKEKAHLTADKGIILFIVSLFILALIFLASNYQQLLNLNYAIFLNPIFQIPISLIFITFLFYNFRIYSEKLNQIQLPKVKNYSGGVVEIIKSETKGIKSISKVIDKDSRKALDFAFDLANASSHAAVDEVHLFTGLSTTQPISTLFMRLGLTEEKFTGPLQRHFSTYARGQTEISPTLNKIFAEAFSKALKGNRATLSAIEIFQATFESSDFLKELFYALDIEENELLSAIDWVRINEQLYERYQNYRRSAAFKPTSNMNRAYTSIATPFLNKLSTDLTAEAVSGHLPMLIDREKEMNELLRAVEGGGRSVMLVGSVGVGKMAIINGLAERMVEENVPKILQDKRLLQLSVPQITASGNAQEKLLIALREAGASGNIILVIDGLDQMLSINPSLGTVLVSELEKRYTFIIATSSIQGFRNLEQSAIPSQFSVIRLEEANKEQTVRVLQSRISGIENQYKVVFTWEALSACVDLSSRYLHDQYQPEKSIILAQEVALQVGRAQDGWQFVTKKHVADLISEKTSVPVYDADSAEKQTLINLEELIHARVIGQDHAVKAVSSALRRARTQLRSNNRPIANFLFLGPTGVGKTELAKATSEVFFGQEEAMMRFDMSEYQEQSSLTRLIGDNGQGGLLTEAVRKQPYGLLLLDELEKAHPDLLNLFLQVMDDGRLTDGAGRTVDFTNIVLIATSNAGTQYIQDATSRGDDLNSIKTYLMENELRGIYRPEFLNRFDEVIVFTPLTQNDVVAIAYLLIDSAKHRLEAKGITLKVSDPLIHQLAEKGYDPKFGARPLRRVIQDEVDNRLADILLREQIGRRDSILLDIDGQVKIEKANNL